jgi:addiction module RelE/StbE family toxin
MDYRILWSPRSLSNLRAVFEFIAHDNPMAAQRFGEKIMAHVERLRAFPRMGERFRKFDRDDVREIAVPPYRIIYHVDDAMHCVSVLSVWHGARQEPDISIP